MEKDYKIEMLKMAQELNELFLEKALTINQKPKNNHDLGVLDDSLLILEKLNEFDKAVSRALPTEASFKRITNKYKRNLYLINEFKTVRRVDKKEFTSLSLIHRAFFILHYCEYISTITNSKFVAKLYTLDGCYIEFVTDVSGRNILKAEILDINDKQLKRYLDKVNISDVFQ
jgi:hypothetical protein